MSVRVSANPSIPTANPVLIASRVQFQCSTAEVSTWRPCIEIGSRDGGAWRHCPVPTEGRGPHALVGKEKVVMGYSKSRFSRYQFESPLATVSFFSRLSSVDSSVERFPILSILTGRLPMRSMLTGRLPMRNILIDLPMRNMLTARASLCMPVSSPSGLDDRPIRSMLMARLLSSVESRLPMRSMPRALRSAARPMRNMRTGRLPMRNMLRARLPMRNILIALLVSSLELSRPILSMPTAFLSISPRRGNGAALISLVMTSSDSLSLSLSSFQ